jgi:hypothetical protein
VFAVRLEKYTLKVASSYRHKTSTYHCHEKPFSAEFMKINRKMEKDSGNVRITREKVTFEHQCSKFERTRVQDP